MFESESDKDVPIAGKVAAELNRLLVETARGTGIIIPLAASLLVLLLWPHVPHAYLLAWAVVLLCLSSARLIVAARYRRVADPASGHAVLARWYIMLTWLLGLVWAALALLPGALASAYTQSVVYVTAMGVVMIGVNILVMNYAALIGYVTPLPVALMIAWNMRAVPGEPSQELSAVMVTGLAFMLWAGWQNHRILRHNLTLRFTNEALVTRLTRSTREARAASEAKGFFLANMSHEIRTPMNAIIGLSHLVQATRLDGRQAQLVGALRAAADSLLTLLNNILDLSKIEAGQLRLERVSFQLPGFLQAIQATLEPLARQKGIELCLEDVPADLPEFVSGDEVRLRQVLFNLVSNAIKFTDQGHVRIAVTAATDTPAAMHGDMVLLFTVADTGAGIPTDKQALIFDHFTQADVSTTRKHGGSGLGLAISRQLVELMGGRIWLSSAEGQGATFYFTAALQAGGLRQEQQRIVQAPARRARSLRVLLVEDNDFNRFIIRTLLEDRQHRVEEALNGIEALRAVADRDYDLVLMDVQMPDMDGVTACHVIRTAERGVVEQTVLPEQLSRDLAARLQHRHLPVVALTANAMLDDREACFNAGMDDYLTKPILPEQLYAAVDRNAAASSPAARGVLAR
ncbi:MAG: ATP-binding protein [Pseudomonadota bacterium]